MPGLDDIKNAAEQHDDQIDKGLDKAGDAAKDKVGGHDDQIDKAVDKGQAATGGDDN
ncbi:antitoxin [Jatrophihabitans sp. YIM 134969]